MTPELRQYLTDWLHWAENGAPNKKPFWRAVGLCAQCPPDTAGDFYRLLADEFGADYTFPFGSENYRVRLANRTQHLCPARLAWVRKVLAEGEGDARL